MLKKLLGKLNSLGSTVARRVLEDLAPSDPSRLPDPGAALADWTPVRGIGGTFSTHRLVRVSPQRVELRASLGAWLFCMLWVFPGVVLAYFSYANLSGQAFSLSLEVVPLLLGLSFAATGGGLLYFHTKPIVFDKQQGYFWKGRKAPTSVLDVTALKCAARIDEIRALQLLKYYQREQRMVRERYELNLVLTEGKRINLVDHGGLARIRVHAGTLAQFLEKPLWDAA